MFLCLFSSACKALASRSFLDYAFHGQNRETVIIICAELPAACMWFHGDLQFK